MTDPTPKYTDLDLALHMDRMGMRGDLEAAPEGEFFLRMGMAPHPALIPLGPSALRGILARVQALDLEGSAEDREKAAILLDEAIAIARAVRVA